MTAPSITPMGRLTEKEQERFEELEFVIRRGWKTFVEVGQALKEINSSRLYRVRHRTFEEYCLDVWGWTRQRAYQLIDGAETAVTLAEVGVDVKSEREARTLKPLAREVARTPRAERTPDFVALAKSRARPVSAPRPAPPTPAVCPAVTPTFSLLCTQEPSGWRAALWSGTDVLHTCEGPSLTQVGQAMDAYLQGLP